MLLTSSIAMDCSIMDEIYCCRYPPLNPKVGYLFWGRNELEMREIALGNSQSMIPGILWTSGHYPKLNQTEIRVRCLPSARLLGWPEVCAGKAESDWYSFRHQSHTPCAIKCEFYIANQCFSRNLLQMFLQSVVKLIQKALPVSEDPSIK